MELLYKTKDKPPFSKMLLAAIQQVLAVLAGTIAVPMVVGNGMSHSAALFGAGVGTIVYLLITRFKCPVFLGSSFSFIGAMLAAFAGAASMSIGYVGLILGALLSSLVYIILSIIVHFAGTNWINKVMPAIVIGPVVMSIGLVLAPNAIQNLFKGGFATTGVNGLNNYLCLACGLVALFTSVITSIHAKGSLKLVPFIIGIIAGYALAALLTLIGHLANNPELMVIDFSSFQKIDWLPDFAFLKAIDGIKEFESSGQFLSYLGIIVASYIPIAFVCFAEHIADHKNLSFIVGEDFIKDPGLSATLMGDGTGSIVGSFFGGCPNTTYGESISCIAFSKNASIATILTAAVISILLSFIGPLMTFFETIPACVMGGICIALYGFIASSGLQMLKGTDMTNHKNIFVMSSILISTIGGLTLQFFNFAASPIACGLVMGIVVNFIANPPFKKKDKKDIETIK